MQTAGFGGVVWDTLPELQAKSFPIAAFAASETADGSGGSADAGGGAIAYEGVAAIVLLHAPKWFQRRYSITIMNALNNLPSDKWAVQVFYADSGQSKAGMELSKGLQRLASLRKDVVMSPIPPEVQAKYPKKYMMMQSKWLWENMLADKVLVFGGNSVVCSNSPHSLADFAHFDWIGYVYVLCSALPYCHLPLMRSH